MLALGANVNIYLVHGGTSFGFDNGANTPPFSIEPTSYDYDAPISEAGDLTPKYFAFKQVIAKYMQNTDTEEVIGNSPKGNYGKVSMKYVSSVFVANGTLLRRIGQNTSPWTFEEIGQENGYILYETVIDKLHTDPALLQITGLHDRAYVFLNQVPQGILSRAENVFSMPLSTDTGDVLQILVENQGRIGYGKFAKDFKGIVSNVTLGDYSRGTAVSLENWTMYSLPLNDTKSIHKYADTLLYVSKNKQDFAQMLDTDLDTTRGKASFYAGEFTAPCSDSATLDTFLSFPNTSWKKGVVFINGKNLGKYWPRIGPQQTLFVPGVWLKKPCQANKIVIFEQDSENQKCAKANNCYVELVPNANIDGPTPYMPPHDMFQRES